MELDISRFWSAAAFRDYSASVAEIGADAGAATWGAANDDQADYPELLATDQQREAFRGFVRDSGGWTWEEIRAWSDAELRALLIQWISGDAREAFPHARTAADVTPEHWAEFEADDSACHRLFRADDGRVFFYVGR